MQKSSDKNAWSRKKKNPVKASFYLSIKYPARSSAKIDMIESYYSKSSSYQAVSEHSFL